MTEHKDDGGPAYPVPSDHVLNPQGGFINLSEYGVGPQPGKSLRDWFAGKALQGYVASAEDFGADSPDLYAHRVAKRSYEIADAMLKARQQ